MALQFWFPFTDGTIENKGVCQDELIIETAPLFKDFGKTGETSYRYGKVKMKAATTAKVLNKNTFSFACWIYPNAETGDTTNRSQLIFGNDPMVENNNRKYSIFNYPSCNDLHLSWQNDDTTYYAGGSWYGVFPSYQWTHFAVTYDNPIYRIYINGELLDEKSGSGNNSSTFAYDTYLFRNPATNNCTFLNDYRVYDTCLSAAEIKELAQGLILHYPLNNSGFGQENLFPCGGTYTKYYPWTSSLSNKDGSKWVTNSAFEGEPGETYTISIECDGNISNSHKTDGSANPADKLWALFIYICNTDTQKNWANNQYDTAVLLHSANNNYRKIGNTHVWTITLTNNQKYISLRTNTYSDGETPVVVNWWNMKIEKGNIFTPWIPNKSSDLYSTLGLNNNIVTDCSGYNRNGIMINNTKYLIDSYHYSTSINFPDNNSCIEIPSIPMQLFNNGNTICFWIKPNNENNDRSIYCASYDGNSYSLEKTSSNKLRIWWAGLPDITTDVTIIDNEWQYITVVKMNDKSTFKIYKNGELSQTLTDTFGDRVWTGTYRLGRDSRENNNVSYIGNMSDFRIYCTPLSAEAIKELYQTSLKIDKAGKDHTFELCETSGLSVNKNGKLISNNFIENGFQFNELTSFSYQPESKENSTSQGIVVDYSTVADLGIPITIKQEADFTWTNFGFVEGQTIRAWMQGSKRQRSDGTYVWPGASYGTASYSILEYMSSSSGTYHFSRYVTIPASWFQTFNGERFGFRTDWSDGNGRITVTNIKITLASDVTKFTKSYISANEFIER